MSKTNTPFFIAGALATLTLLASGVFAIAPYIAFLSPIAALGISLPVIFTLFVLSAVVIAISCKIISQNKKLDAKEAELNKKNGLAKEQGEIEEVKKKLISLTTKLDEISKQVNDAAVKDKVEALEKSFEKKCEEVKNDFNSFTTEISKQVNGAITKDKVEALGKSFAAQLDKISKQISSAATKDELEELKRGTETQFDKTFNQIDRLTKGEIEEVKKKLISLTTKLDEISKQVNDAAVKDKVEALEKSFEKKCEEVKNDFNSFTTEISKQVNGAITKDKVEALGKSFEKKCEEMENNFNNFTTEILKRASSTETKVKNLENRCKTRFDGASKLIDSFTTTCKMEEELQMKFYAKDAVREDVTFDHIILPIGIKQRLEEICESQKELDHSEKKMKGYVLHGPPGTGKTMIARAIANNTRYRSAFISVSASDLSSKSNINKLFDKAKENTPCIIFIDEIDSIGKSRKLVNEKDNTGPLTHLLTKLDGFSSAMIGVTVVAATNHIDNLDEALIRHGRLSEHIEVPRLNKKTREDIIRDHLGSILIYPHHRLKVAEGTEGFSPANLLGLIKKIRDLNEAKKLNKNKIGEVCEEYKKTHNIGKTSDDKHGDRQKVGNKHRSSRDKSLGAGSQQSQRSTSRPISTCTSSEQKPFSTSTPVNLQKKRKEVPSQELAGTYISPISNSTETDTINDSNSNELYQNIPKSPSQQEPIKRNKRRSSKKENKENSWQQDQKSPNTSINSTSTLPLKMQQVTTLIRVKNDIAHILY